MSTIINDLLIVASETLEYPLTHSRFGIERVDGEYTASSELKPVIALTNQFTSDRWKPASYPAWVMVDAGADVAVDYCGIVGAFSGSTFTIQHSSDGVAWTDIDSATVVDNDPLMFLFQEVVDRYFRVSIQSPVDINIAVLQFGKSFAMMRPINQHVPIVMQKKTTFNPSESESGQWLGRDIIRQGYSGQMRFNNLKGGWIREQFKPRVMDKVVRSAFFVSHRPIKYPNETAFVWTNSDIHPTKSAIKDWFDVTIQVVGYGG